MTTPDIGPNPEQAGVRALYVGSFDPVTLGHLSVIQAGTRITPNLHVAVGTNPTKKPLFTIEERMDMLGQAIAELDIGGSITIGSLGNQFAVNYAKEMGCSVLIRGLRSVNDFTAETDLAIANREEAPDIQTLYVPCPPDRTHISSSAVKGLLGVEGWERVASKFVTPSVLEALKRKYQETVAVS